MRSFIPWGLFAGICLGDDLRTIKTRIPQDEPTRPPHSGDRTGNWTTLSCTHPAVVNPAGYTPAQRWSELDVDHAWRDVVAVYEEAHKPNFVDFGESLFSTLRSRPSPGCGTMSVNTGCRIPTECNTHAGSGPAGHLVLNSLIHVNSMFYILGRTLSVIRTDELEPLYKFKMAPGNLTGRNDEDISRAIRNVLGASLIANAVPVMNTFLQDIQSGAGRSTGDDEANKEVIVDALSVIVSVIKERADRPWIEVGYSYTGSEVALQGLQLVEEWANITETASRQLFSGDDKDIQTLSAMISNGTMLGNADGTRLIDDHISRHVEALKSRAVSMVISTLWSLSGQGVFVLDADHECGTDPQSTSNLSKETARETGACYEGRQYYLVSTTGGGQFKTPPELEWLKSSIEVEALVGLAVKAWKEKGQKNSPMVLDTSNAAVVDQLYERGINTPGVIQVPVCGREEAGRNRNGKERYDTFPCDKVEKSVVYSSAAMGGFPASRDFQGLQLAVFLVLYYTW
ncbi:hypothetical protein OQA88_8184 [Cercophora sp. LCS_1]